MNLNLICGHCLNSLLLLRKSYENIKESYTATCETCGTGEVSSIRCYGHRDGRVLTDNGILLGKDEKNEEFPNSTYDSSTFTDYQYNKL
tara:strand:+ start:3694 stop:3960 length:267 start_codon:yes stop_codon:yes gene_type:complete